MPQHWFGRSAYLSSPLGRRGGERELGRINALVNNARVDVFAEPLETSDEEWNRCFYINMKGAWNCSKAVLPGLIEEGDGIILNIASTHAFAIIPHTFPYPLAKHALLGMTKSLGLEYAPKNVRVNALASGCVTTQKVIDYWHGFADPEAARAETMKLHPGGDRDGGGNRHGGGLHDLRRLPAHECHQPHRRLRPQRPATSGVSG